MSPIPTPDGEDEKTFVDRCMSDENMQEYDKDQRYAICIKQFTNKESNKEVVMSPEEIQKVVTESVGEAIAPLVKRVSDLEETAKAKAKKDEEDTQAVIDAAAKVEADKVVAEQAAADAAKAEVDKAAEAKAESDKAITTADAALTSKIETVAQAVVDKALKSIAETVESLDKRTSKSKQLSDKDPEPVEAPTRDAFGRAIKKS